MGKRLSRPKRWAEICGRASEALSLLDTCIDELEELKGEYEDWRDNLPDNLEGSALAEKLDAICDLDLRYPFEELEGAMSEAADVELPRGFGRD